MLTSVFDLVEIEGGSSLLILKVLRTLRLLKLVKLARGSRVFKRWEMRLSINYQALSLFTILVVIIPATGLPVSGASPQASTL